MERERPYKRVECSIDAFKREWPIKIVPFPFYHSSVVKNNTEALSKQVWVSMCKLVSESTLS